MSMAKRRDTERWEYQTQNLATSSAERSAWFCMIGGVAAAMVIAGFLGYVLAQTWLEMWLRTLVVLGTFFGILRVSRKMCAANNPAPTEAATAREAAATGSAAARTAETDLDSKAAAEAKANAEIPASAEPSGDTIGTRPEALSAARGGEADDLKLIKGVGPKLEDLCNRLGFYHFDQIAAWTADEVVWVDENLEGFKGRVSRDDWVAQAKILAAGGETEFSERQN